MCPYIKLIFLVFSTANLPNDEKNKEEANSAAKTCDVEAVGKDNTSEPHARIQSIDIGDANTEPDPSSKADQNEESSLAEGSLTTTTEHCKIAAGSSDGAIVENFHDNHSTADTITSDITPSSHVRSSSEDIETEPSLDPDKESSGLKATDGEAVSENVSRADDTDVKSVNARESSVSIAKPASKFKVILARMFPCIFKQSAGE